MEDITSYLLYLFLGILILIAIFMEWNRYQKRKALLEYQSEKRGGEIVAGSWFGWTKLRVPCQGESLEIFMIPGSRYQPARTRVFFTPQRVTFTRCRLMENSLWRRMTINAETERVLTHDEDFDRRYILTATDDPSLAARLVHGSVRERLLQFKFPEFEIKASPEAFEMNMSRIPQDDSDFDNFIETAITIIQHL